MPFITKSNLASVLKKIDYDKIQVDDNLIYHKKIFILGTREKKEIIGLRLLLEDTEQFILEYYDPNIKIDSLQFVYEGGSPAYHCNYQCEKLSAKYNNFRIPQEIITRARDKGGAQLVEAEVKKFRKWFNENKHILESNPNSFLVKLAAVWRVGEPLKAIEANNSGIEYIENVDLSQLEKTIDQLLNEASKLFKNSNEEKKQILRRFGTAAYYHSKEGVSIDRTFLRSLSEKEVKAFLKDYEQRIKLPLRQALKDYYRVKANPNLTFEGFLLDKLKFKKCSTCYRNGEDQSDCEPIVPKYLNDYNYGHKIRFEDVPFPTIDDFRDYRK